MLHKCASSIPNSGPFSILTMSTLSDRLREALNDTGITQAELARACGVTPSAVSQWLDGQTKNMKMAYIFKAADFLGVQDRWLAIGAPPKERKWTPVAVEIADYISSLPHDRQHGLRAGFGLPEKHGPGGTSSENL